jgi:Ca2+-binding RTX toxin-like protein
MSEGMHVVEGTNGNDSLWASTGVTNGDDLIWGYGGNDSIYGLEGNDHIIGGAGADFMDGGLGSDWADYFDSPLGVMVSLLNGRGYGGDAEGDVLTNIEKLWGSEHDDILIGDANDNRLCGLSGNDIVDGGNGNDIVMGFEGNDTLKGGGGHDRLVGGEGVDILDGMDGNDALVGDWGADRLTGGLGRDWLTGGPGNDVFVWTSTAESGVTASTRDVVEDFSFAECDRLDLSGIDADVYALGNQAFTFIGDNAFSGTPGEIRYSYLNGDTILQLQTGTSVDVEATIRLEGIHTPQASWFVL